ncbi:hypothetical protein ACFLY6_03105 [Candidatus Dependentiae bacterium]
MEDKNNLKKIVGVWLTLLAVTCGLSLIGAKKRPRIMKRIVTSQVSKSATEQPTISSTQPEPVKSVVQKTVAETTPETETIDKPPTPPRFDISELARIKVFLKSDDQGTYRKGVNQLLSFLKKADTDPTRLETLPEKEYNQIYDAISDAHDRVSWSWKTDKNWLTIHGLTQWTYENFPYKEGLITGNKNHIEEMHIKSCEALKDKGPEYKFEKIKTQGEQVAEGESVRIPWRRPGDEQETVYKWPAPGVKYTSPFTENDYAQLDARLDKFDRNFEVAKDKEGVQLFDDGIKAMKVEFTAMTVIMRDVKNPLHEKAEKRIFKTLDDGVYDALRTSKFGSGVREEASYNAALEFFESVEKHFSTKYKDKLIIMIEDTKDARDEYGQE